MFKKLSLENFKCFTQETIDFNDITILCGANAAGKSTIIQALLLYVKSVAQKGGIIKASETIEVQVGSPRNLVAHHAVGNTEYDFKLSVDGESVRYYIDKESGLNLTAEVESDVEERNICYLNAERVGPRAAYDAGGIQFAARGENAVYMIEYADNNGIKVSDKLMVPGCAGKFSKQVEAWLAAILGEVEIAISVDTVKAQAELKIKNLTTDEFVLPTQTGFGISYVLPIVAAGLWASSQKDRILVVENPEAHLHPSAQSMMGKFLALVADSGTQVIVETHSEHIVDGARIQMTYLKRSEAMLVNYIMQENGKTDVRRLDVNGKGELSDWPEGFFDQKQTDLRELFLMRKKNGDKQ